MAAGAGSEQARASRVPWPRHQGGPQPDGAARHGAAAPPPPDTAALRRACSRPPATPPGRGQRQSSSILSSILSETPDTLYKRELFKLSCSDTESLRETLT